MTPRLFLAVAGLEARSSMSYRVDFWIGILAAPLAQLAISYAVWTSIFAARGTDAIAGLGLADLVRYYVAAILVGRLTQGREFNDAVMSEIYQGDLNRYLVYPVAYGAIKYAQHLGSLVPLVLQVAVMAAAAHAFVPGGSIADAPPTRIAMCAASIAVANAMSFALGFQIQCVAFWADNVWSLVATRQFVQTLFGGLWFPLAVFPAAWREVLEWLPFRFIYDVPARVLLGQATVEEWTSAVALCAGWTVVFVASGALVWRAGRRRYTGVGM